jgi:formylglycine-generating enzyme required for sulfatase activity
MRAIGPRYSIIPIESLGHAHNGQSLGGIFFAVYFPLAFPLLWFMVLGMFKTLPVGVPAPTKQDPLLKKAIHTIRRLFLLGGLTLFAAHNLVSAQGPSGGVQSVQLEAGITVTGVVGYVYAIQTTTDLSNPDSWVNLLITNLPSSSYSYADTQNPVTSNRFYRAVRQLVATNMIYISPGTFIMGSPTAEVGRSGDETEHTVVLTRGFYMGKYLVRQADYLALMGTNPSNFTPSYGYDQNLNRPVEMVSWNDASNYCARFTQQEAAAGMLAPGWQYRLPTEAEWEYACRAGTTTRFSYGDDPGYADLDSYAWYKDDSEIETHSVGKKMPNPLGLCDMHGDVAEWCQDWYASYPSGTVADPQGPATGQHRVCRGGSWNHTGGWCRSAQRFHNSPTTTSDLIGFRMVVAPPQP